MTPPLEVLTTNEPDRWMNALHAVGEYDFYHLPGYQRLTESQVGGRAILPVFRCEGYAMAFPLLIRDIAIQGIDSSGYRDAACVPGLTGPLVSDSSLPDGVRHSIMQQFHDYLRQNKLVSVYNRLHFLMGQEAFLSGYGEVHEEGIEVTVDLTAPPDVQYSRYRENHRRDLNRLRKLGFICQEAGQECLDDFLRVYYETMDIVGAAQLYYHDKGYFEYLMTELKDESRLFACKDGQTVVCAGFIASCNGHVHYLRGGTATEYRNLAPSKLMLDTVRVWGNSVGARVFHLGGGASGARDSLYRFKMGFGGQEHPCHTWRYVADPEVYDDLCRRAFALAGRTPDDSYFPEYRSPSLGLIQEAKRA